MSFFRLLAALVLLTPAALLAQTRVTSGDVLELDVSSGDGTTVIARYDGISWAPAAHAAPLVASGATIPVTISVTGLGFGSIFAVCGDVTVASAQAVEGMQTLDLPAGDCAVGVLSTSGSSATMALVVRETAVPAPAPVELDLTADLSTATAVLRDETGTVVTPPELDRILTTNMFSAPPRPDGHPYRIRLLGSLSPAGTSAPVYRYSVPDGQDVRIEWSLRTWPSAPRRYHFKGRLDDFGGDRTMGNTAADLRRVVVEHALPEGTGAVRSNATTLYLDESGAGIPSEVFVFSACDVPPLPPPHVQTVYEMADPAPDFFARPGQFSTQMDATVDVWDPATDGVQASPCSELKPGDTYAVAPPQLQRGADGQPEAFAYGFEAGASVLVGDTLRHGLAPLVFTPRIAGAFGGARLLTSASFSSTNLLWPLGGNIRAPLVSGALGDARPAKMPFEILNGAGDDIVSGADLTELLSFELPLDGAAIRASYTDPVVRVGGLPATVAVDLMFDASAPDPGPPYLQRLTLEAGGRYTSTVPVGSGTLRLAVADADGEVATVEAAVGSEGAWTPLALASDGDGAYHADLDLPGGVYGLRIIATDVVGNTAQIVSAPAFEVAGVVSAAAGPGAAWLGEASPNPARTHATFRAELDGASVFRAELFDALGRRVHVAETACAAGACVLRVDVDALPPGLYLALLSSGARTETRRLIVSR